MTSPGSTPVLPDVTQLGYRWVMVTSLWFMYFAFGVVGQSITPLVGPISEDLGLSRAQMGTVLGSWHLMYVGLAIPAGFLIDRFGLRLCLGAGVFFIALSGLLSAAAVSYPTLLAAFAVFGLGGPFISVGAPKLLTTWFDRKDRGKAIGIYLTGPPLGGAVSVITANSVFMPLTDSSWRLTLVIFASVAALALFTWALLSRNPEHLGARVQDSGETSAGLGLQAFSTLLRVPVVRIILLMGLGLFVFQSGLAAWLPEILRVGGMTAAKAGYWAAVPGILGIIGVLTIPPLATPRHRIPFLAALFITGSIATVIIGLTDSPFLVIGLLLVGATRGGVLPITHLVLMDAPKVGIRNMGAAGGLYFTFAEMGAVVGPVAMGVVADSTLGFRGGLLMLSGVGFSLAALALVLAIMARGAQRTEGAPSP